MLDINFIRNNADKVRTAIKSKGLDTVLDLNQLLELDERKRTITTTVDALRQQRNQLSSAIPKLAEQEKLGLPKRLSR
jgi:seryl-tRNA synthetase